MIKRFLILIMLLISFSSAYSVSCNFQSNTCQRTSNAFNTFHLVFSNQSYLNSYTATIYNKANPENQIRVIVNQNSKTVRNVNPFIDSGVYVLEVNAMSQSGMKNVSKYEFVFDNLQPMPPFIDANLNSNSISGKTQFSNTTVIAKNILGKIIANVTSNSNGDFTISNLGLPNGINYVGFYSISKNGIESAPLERLVKIGNFIENDSNQISSIKLSDVNSQNIRTDNYITTKRNFYISGVVQPAAPGTVVFVNGIKTITDSSGKFGAFVLLNEGLNNITVQNSQGQVFASTSVTYINPKFKFLTFNSKKIIDQNNLNIKGSDNYDVPFNVYLNGKFKKTITSNNGVFNFNITDFNPEKNYLYIQGYNDESLNKIIYYDTSAPKISLLSQKNIANSNNFIFKIADDVSVNISSIKVDFGNGAYDFSGDQINRIGDFYGINIYKIPDGSYPFTIKASDLTGKSTTYTGTFDISKDNTVIENIYSTGGSFVGNQLYLKSSNPEIIITPSRYIAFKSIYLNGIRQTNYQIMPNGEIHLNLKNLNDSSSGILNFTFVNNKLQKFNQVYYYFTDFDRPKIVLDYVQNSNIIPNHYVKISGKVIDSNFNWSSLEFNSQKNFIRFGNYFEGYVLVDKSGLLNLNVYGKDYAGNLISSQNRVYDGLFYGDISSPQVNVLNSLGTDQINLAINPTSNLMHFINSYDGFDFNNIYANPQNFSLPVADREGLQDLNLFGTSSSGVKFNSLKTISVDNIPPKIVLAKGSDEKLRLIFDGTLSSIVKSSINISADNSPINQLSYCKDSLSVFSDCVFAPTFNSSLSVNVKDAAGNSIHKVFTKADIVDLSSLQLKSTKAPEIFFSGNNLKTTSSNSFIEGQIKSYNKISSVKVGSTSCQFDDFNFVCPINNLKNGLNSFKINVVDSNNQIASKTWTIDKINPSFKTSIINISGINSQIFKIGSTYYTSTPNLNLVGNVNPQAISKLLINGREILLGKKEGNFSIPVDLSQDVNGKDSTTLNLKLKAEDQYGNSATSNEFTIIYQRIVKTLVSIFIN